jgi:hypothetical protein
MTQSFAHEQFEQRWTLPSPLSYAEEDRITRICKLIPGDVSCAIDIGAGQGWLTSCLRSMRPEIDMIGVDWSLSGMHRFPGKVVVALCNVLPFTTCDFDLVTCCDCLEHLPTGVYEGTLREMKHLSRRYIIINTPVNEGIIGRDRSTCLCPRCRRLFHCDHHVRYFTEGDYERLLAPEYRLISKTYGGWDIRFAIKLPLSWAGAMQWGWRPKLICPYCGNRDFPNPL